jgi:hypothetical protein
LLQALDPRADCGLTYPQRDGSSAEASFADDAIKCLELSCVHGTPLIEDSDGSYRVDCLEAWGSVT